MVTVGGRFPDLRFDSASSTTVTDGVAVSTETENEMTTINDLIAQVHTLEDEDDGHALWLALSARFGWSSAFVTKAHACEVWNDTIDPFTERLFDDETWTLIQNSYPWGRTIHDQIAVCETALAESIASVRRFRNGGI
mgnify:CR=1 FL=1